MVMKKIIYQKLNIKNLDNFKTIFELKIFHNLIKLLKFD